MVREDGGLAEVARVGHQDLAVTRLNPGKETSKVDTFCQIGNGLEWWSPTCLVSVYAAASLTMVRLRGDSRATVRSSTSSAARTREALAEDMLDRR